MSMIPAFVLTALRHALKTSEVSISVYYLVRISVRQQLKKLFLCGVLVKWWNWSKSLTLRACFHFHSLICWPSPTSTYLRIINRHQFVNMVLVWNQSISEYVILSSKSSTRFLGMFRIIVVESRAIKTYQTPCLPLRTYCVLFLLQYNTLWCGEFGVVPDLMMMMIGKSGSSSYPITMLHVYLELAK